MSTGEAEGSVRACPFCGCANIGEITDLAEHLQDTFKFFCRNCSNATSEYLNRDCAIEAWNRRAPAAATGGDGPPCPLTAGGRHHFAGRDPATRTRRCQCGLILGDNGDLNVVVGLKPGQAEPASDEERRTILWQAIAERDDWRGRCERAEAKVATLQLRTQRHERAKDLGQAVEADVATMNALREERDAAVRALAEVHANKPPSDSREGGDVRKILDEGTVERVARAILDESAKWTNQTEPTPRAYERALARAAIAALSDRGARGDG